MTTKIHRHLRANAVGYVAVFLALTGTAVALPGRATVQSNDLKPNAVKAKHVKDAQLTGAEVAPDSLTGDDLATLTGADLQEASLTGEHVADGSLSGADIDEDTLGGGGLVKRCTDGSVHGAIRVNGSEGFSASFTTAETQGFSCTPGAPPLARRTAAGVYEVCFPSGGAASQSVLNLAIGSALQTGAGSVGEDNFLTVGTKQDLPTCDNSDGATFEVRVQDIGDSGATLQDGVFMVAVVD